MRLPELGSDRTVRVVVVDDHDLFRQGVRALLENQGMHVIGEAGDGDDAVRLVIHSAPDVVVMDLNMPRMSGVEATRRLAEVSPATRVVVLSMSADEETVADALLAGACGYVLKDGPPGEIAAAVQAAAAGHVLITPQIAARLIDRLRSESPGAPVAGPGLTERESEVLKLLAEGGDNGAIAERLGISPGTVKNHVASILAKLQLENRIQAAVYAVRQGIV